MDSTNYFKSSKSSNIKLFFIVALSFSVFSSVGQQSALVLTKEIDLKIKSTPWKTNISKIKDNILYVYEWNIAFEPHILPERKDMLYKIDLTSNLVDSFIISFAGIPKKIVEGGININDFFFEGNNLNISTHSSLLILKRCKNGYVFHKHLLFDVLVGQLTKYQNKHFVGCMMYPFSENDRDDTYAIKFNKKGKTIKKTPIQIKGIEFSRLAGDWCDILNHKTLISDITY